MLRYIVATVASKNPLDLGAVRGVRESLTRMEPTWRAALDRPRIFAAFLDSRSQMDQTILLPDNHGAIFGSLFASPDLAVASVPRSITSLSRDETETLVRSKGRSLVRNVWGNYVAVLYDPQTEGSVFLRGPVSPIPAFRLRLGSLNVFFSHLDDFIGLKLTRLSINWDSITAQVAGGDYLTAETAFNEIDALECGECIECNRDGCSTVSYWDPRSFLRSPRIERFDEAAKAFRQATDHCVIAHSLSASSILVSLSGGLDSSIVLSSLTRSPHSSCVTAINYYSRGGGDERRFARSMALKADCRLVERERNQYLDLNRFMDCNRTVRPVLNFSAPDVESRNSELARQINASVIFNGELGDNVFGSRPGIGAVAEAMRQLGVSRGSLQAALDYAYLTRQSLWRTLSLTRRQQRQESASPNFNSSLEMLRQSDEAAVRSMLLASPEAIERYTSIGNRFIHPWMKESRRIAPGSQALLFGLIAVTSTSYHSPFSNPSDPQRLSPLVSQPLVEIALRVPAYFHCHGGQDRAVARAAFADTLPPTILDRGLGKGGPTLWAKDVVERNQDFLREYLLDGILADRRLIDRNKLRSVLSPKMAKSSVTVGDIFAKLYIEAWLRKFVPS